MNFDKNSDFSEHSDEEENCSSCEEKIDKKLNERMIEFRDIRDPVLKKKLQDLIESILETK